MDNKEYDQQASNIFLGTLIISNICWMALFALMTN